MNKIYYLVITLWCSIQQQQFSEQAILSQQTETNDRVHCSINLRKLKALSDYKVTIFCSVPVLCVPYVLELYKKGTFFVSKTPCSFLLWSWGFWKPDWLLRAVEYGLSCVNGIFHPFRGTERGKEELKIKACGRGWSWNGGEYMKEQQTCGGVWQVC